MLKRLERSIALQLLVFYCLFIVPLILGGIELDLFQRDALQQSTQRSDLGIAQAISLEVGSNVQSAIEEDIALSRSRAAGQLNLPQLASIFATAGLSHPDISLYFVCDPSGHMLLSYPVSQSAARPGGTSCDYILPAHSTQNSEQPYLSSERLSPTTQTNVVSVVMNIQNARGHMAGIMGIDVSLGQLTALLVGEQQQLAANGENHIWLVDEHGTLLASTGHVPFQADLRPILPDLRPAFQGKSGNVIARAQNRDWLYSYVAVRDAPWAVILQQPTDVTFAAITSFQNSLLLALVTLIIGASFFWLALHGWVMAPLKKLAQAVSMIRPDQPVKVTESETLAKDRSRSDEIGQLIAAFSTMEDEIHALFRKSDEKSQARLHMLDAIMRSMDEGVLLERPDGHVIYANQSYTQFVGLAPQDFLQEDAFDGSQAEEKLLALADDPAAYRASVCEAENSAGSATVAFMARGYYNNAGQFVPVRRDIRMRLFQVRDMTGQLIGRGKIFRDVTQQNEAEQIKKNLLAIVSHELRTPLTAIKGYATSLLATDVELDETLQEYFLRRIVEEGDRMAELVTSLLEMSQVEAGTLKLSLSLHRLDALIEQAVPVEARSLVRVQMPEDLPLLYIDRRRMEMVLRNLVENARRYAGADAEIEILARYEPGRPASGLSISLTDSGPGLSPDLTERIFDRFYQMDGGRQRSSSGVGLGLAICRGFVEAHGGRIWAQNRVDGVSGAVFHIWLPPHVLHPPGVQPELRGAL